jgi:hypothetical protein
LKRAAITAAQADWRSFIGHQRIAHDLADLRPQAPAMTKRAPSQAFLQIIRDFADQQWSFPFSG